MVRAQVGRSVESLGDRRGSRRAEGWRGRVGDALRVGVADSQGEARRGGKRAGDEAPRVVELVDAIGPAVDDPQTAAAGRVERDAGRAGAGPGDRPTAEERARQV